MARPKKQVQPSEKKVEANDAEELKELKFLAEIREKELEILYKDLAILKDLVNTSLNQVGLMDQCETLSEAAFRAGRAYGPLDKANDKLDNMLTDLYEGNDFEYYTDIIDEMNDNF